MSDETRLLAGVLLLALVTVETGGLYLVKLWRSSEGVTEFQIGFARAGHAHAGVLLVLSLTALLYADTAGLSGAWNWLARTGVPVAAILMPAGFFFSSMGRGRTRPNATDRAGVRGCRRARARAGQPRDRAAHGLSPGPAPGGTTRPRRGAATRRAARPRRARQVRASGRAGARDAPADRRPTPPR